MSYTCQDILSAKPLQSKECVSPLLLGNNLQCILSSSPSHSWSLLVDSVHSRDPLFQSYDEIFPTGAIFFKSLNISTESLDKELENHVMHHRALLRSYNSRHGKEVSFVDALFFLCHNFYKRHLAKLARDNQQDSLGGPKYLRSLEDLSIELAFDAMGKLKKMASVENNQLDLEKTEIAMLKSWLGWISQGKNVSAYGLISEIFDRVCTADVWSNNLSNRTPEDPNIVHFCLFGAFICSEGQKSIHHPIKAFLSEQEAPDLLINLLYYKIMLNLIENTLCIRVPLRAGTIYVVDSDTMRVTESICINKLLNRYSR